MVAHLLRLKLALLRNSLRRGVAVIVGLVFGVLYGGGFLLFALGGLVALRVRGDLAAVHAVVVLGGAAVTLGWALLPIVLFGTDPTLDPARFATFAGRERVLAWGLALTGFVGLPGRATLLLGAGVLVATSMGPGAVLVALVAVPAGLMACVLLSRIVTAVASAVLASRRGRDLAGVAGLVLLLLVGPLAGMLGEGTPSGEVTRRVAES